MKTLIPYLLIFFSSNFKVYSFLVIIFCLFLPTKYKKNMWTFLNQKAIIKISHKNIFIWKKQLQSNQTKQLEEIQQFNHSSF